MRKRTVLYLTVSAWLLIMAGSICAQEASIQHGFLFLAGEKYTVDEKTYGIYEDGNRFEDLIKQNAEALDEFRSYENWHTTALVFTGISLLSFAFGGVYYMFEKDLSNTLGEHAGLYGFAAGGGLLAFGMASEFIAWGSISSAAETYTQALMEEGPAWNLQTRQGPRLAFQSRGMQFSWVWNF